MLDHVFEISITRRIIYLLSKYYVEHMRNFKYFVTRNAWHSNDVHSE